MQQRI